MRLGENNFAVPMPDESATWQTAGLSSGVLRRRNNLTHRRGQRHAALNCDLLRGQRKQGCKKSERSSSGGPNNPHLATMDCQLNNYRECLPHSRCNSGMSHQFYNLSAWKQYAATSKPNGMASGRVITPTSLQVRILSRSLILQFLRGNNVEQPMTLHG